MPQVIYHGSKSEAERIQDRLNNVHGPLRPNSTVETQPTIASQIPIGRPVMSRPASMRAPMKLPRPSQRKGAFNVEVVEGLSGRKETEHAQIIRRRHHI